MSVRTNHTAGLGELGEGEINGSVLASVGGSRLGSTVCLAISG